MQVEVGAVVEGTVTGITKFGAFVSLPDGRSGLVHISEIANTYVNDVNEFLKLGDKVKVRVLAVTPDGKINLSIKKAEPAPERPNNRPMHGGRPGGSRPNNNGGAPRAARPELKPPFVCLAISGGNTLICDVRDYTDLRILGATRDDAAGECFDKTARVLGLPYPGGKPIDDLSKTGDDRKYKLPIGHVDGCPYDMSFSGLKTAVINLAHTAEQKGEPLDKPSLAASFCRAMSESLVPRTMAAVRELGYDKLAVAGGVAANSRIRGDFQAACDAAGIRLFVPPLKLCGDNAAMIGCQAYYEYLRGARAGSELNAWANMEISEVPFYGRA